MSGALEHRKHRINFMVYATRPSLNTTMSKCSAVISQSIVEAVFAEVSEVDAIKALAAIVCRRTVFLQQRSIGGNHSCKSFSELWLESVRASVSASQS